MQLAALLRLVHAYWIHDEVGGLGAMLAAALRTILAWSPWNGGPTLALLSGTVVSAGLVGLDMLGTVRPSGSTTRVGDAAGRRAAADPALPSVSVIVPVLRGGEDLTRCLDAIAALYPAPAEVLVVADGDDADDVRRAQRHDVTILRLPRRGGPARARNAAARQARGDVLLFLDADVVTAPGVVGQVATHLATHPEVAAVIGSYDDAPAAQNLMSQYKNLQNHFVHQHAHREGFTFWAGCGAIRTAAYRSLGGFDESFAVPSVEDIELGYRLIDAGGRIHVLSDVQVTHLKRWGLRSLFLSDVFRRALPWSALILRTGRIENDLNVDVAGRVKVTVASGAVAAGFLTPWVPYATAGMAALLTVLVVLEAPILGFYARVRGPWFALRILPWQVFFHVYCGVAFAWSVAAHLTGRLMAVIGRERAAGAVTDRGGCADQGGRDDPPTGSAAAPAAPCYGASATACVSNSPQDGTSSEG